MPAIPGNKIAVGVYDETTYGVIGATGTRLAFSQFGLVPGQPRNRSAVLSGYYGQSRGVLGNKNPAGPIVTECGPETIGWFLKHLIGTPVSAVSGSAFKHTFAVGDGAAEIPVGFSAEQDFTTALGSATHRILRYLGCRLNNGSLSFGSSGFIGVNFGVLAADFEADSDPADASLTDLGHTSFSASNTAIVFDNGAAMATVKVREQTLNFSNDLDPEYFDIGGGGVRADLPRGLVGLEGQGTFLFDNDAMLKQTLADTDVSVVTTLTRGAGDGTAGNEKLVLTQSAVAFAPAGVAVQGPRGLLLPATFSAHRTTGEIGITAELWNPQATI